MIEIFVANSYGVVRVKIVGFMGQIAIHVSSKNKRGWDLRYKHVFGNALITKGIWNLIPMELLVNLILFRGM